MSNKKMIKPLQILSVGALSTLILIGCNEDSNSNSTKNPEQNTPTVPSQNVGSISGIVVDQISLAPIANATITIAGKKYISSATGSFQLPDLTVGESVTLTINAEGYPERTFTTVVASTAPLSVEYQLNNDDTIVSVVQTSKASVNLVIERLGAKVTIPANALQRADGQPIVGDISVTMDVIRPAINSDEMPGGYGIVGGGFMESWGALKITAIDSAKNDLVIADGSRASLVIPVSTRSLEPLKQQMPLFFYNAIQQGWVQTGTAELQTLANGVQAYTASVDTIGSWNIDVAMDTVNVTGCVADTDGVRVKNALVKSDGINYSSVTTAIANSNGDFTLPARRNSQLYVYAQNGSRTSNAKPITTLGGNYRITDGCLTVSTENDNLSIRLTWGERPRDVDSHLLTPSGDHIYYSNKGNLSSAPFANLDVDDTDSFGPEFVTVRNLMVGRYRYGVHNYSGTQGPGIKDSPVSVFLAGPTIRSRTLTPTVNDTGTSSYFWHSFDLVVDERCNITYQTVDRWLTVEEERTTFRNTAESTPRYCTAP
ncbi:carboxypeptidase regulatory-like domain-containing protein [Psychrobacter sp. DAB_AL62B]|uniref:carboxypeptidase regulatory-like domain-containing protein n=1 Tax=Psychrobacter sp. DAB_AL62B TaxID=1028420 RepID=UPI0023811B27|nr:carboxypeptidase regulatory-like domain-containing protein [Psychrobacter sp. DAB_AL62B]MDE4454417.1 hypothetical protein [Psychrobacter sp. DAB_AL62B]